MLPRALPELRSGSAAPLDPAGVALATLALTALVLPLVEGRAQGWPAWAWVSLGLAPLLFAGFLAAQRRRAVPLVDLGWFRDRAFRVGTATQFGFWCGQASYFLVLALWLQAINSDVLSAVEKRSPSVSLKRAGGGDDFTFVIHRTRRVIAARPLSTPATIVSSATTVSTFCTANHRSRCPIW